MVNRYDRLAALGSLLALTATGYTFADAAQLRVAAYLPAHSKSVGQVMIPWLDRIEAAGGGAIRFERYWGGSLGRGPHRQVLLLESGVTEIAFLWPGMTRGRFPELELLEAPMFVETAREGALLAWRLHEEGLLSGFEQLEVLGFYTVAPARLFTVEPPPSVTDLAPLKIRTVGPVQANFVRSLGGLPETLDAAAVSDALRRGTVDGLIQGWTGLATFRQYREADYVIDIPAGVLTFAVAMNAERWRALDSDLKQLIRRESGEALAEFAGQVFDREARAVSAQLIRDGHLEPVAVSDSDREAFRRLGRQAVERWAGDDARRHRVAARAREILESLR